MTVRFLTFTVTFSTSCLISLLASTLSCDLTDDFRLEDSFFSTETLRSSFTILAGAVLLAYFLVSFSLAALFFGFDLYDTAEDALFFNCGEAP